MNRSIKQIIFSFLAMVFLLNACSFLQPAPSPEQVANQVATSVMQTMTAISANIPTPTNTPLPTPTETFAPTPIIVFPTAISAGSPIPTAKPDYACDIIDQRPFDDTKFHRNEDFDVKWTIVNTGGLRWENGTYLEYQNGPQMTPTDKVELPRLKPGEHYDIIFDATAPSELDTQIMVWAIVGPGTVKNSMYWMCYPYIRIIVEK
jgi:hypothetical protein